MKQLFQSIASATENAAAHMATLALLLLFAFSLTGKVQAQQNSSKKTQTEQSVADDCNDDLECHTIGLHIRCNDGREFSESACPVYVFGITEAPSESDIRPPQYVY